MEFLKELFGDGVLTYSQLSEKLKGNKDIKLANLTSGQYVDKQKLTDKESELKTANTTIADLQGVVSKFDGVDIEGLKGELSTLQAKYSDDVAKLKLDAALDLVLIQNKAKNPKIIKAALNMDNIKLDGDKVLGLDEQISMLKETIVSEPSESIYINDFYIEVIGKHIKAIGELTPSDIYRAERMKILIRSVKS